MTKAINYNSEFCVFCGKPKTFIKWIPSKLGIVMVSLCDDETERDDEDILDVISDKL